MLSEKQRIYLSLNSYCSKQAFYVDFLIYFHFIRIQTEHRHVVFLKKLVLNRFLSKIP